MKSGFRAAGLAEPTFESDERGDSFRVVFASRTGSIRNADVRGLAGRTIVRASGLLRRLADLGLSTERGGGSATFYAPTGSLRAAETAQAWLGFGGDDADDF